MSDEEDLANDPDAQMAFMQLWAKHPELGNRFLTEVPDDDFLWREFGVFYNEQTLPPMEPDPQESSDSKVRVKTGIVRNVKAANLIRGRTTVKPEVAAEIIKNLANKKPPFRPELGEVGEVSWFTTEGNPHTGAGPAEGKTVTIEAEISVHPKDLVFREADLVAMRDAALTPQLQAQIEAQVRARKGRLQGPLNRRMLSQIERDVKRAAEKLMWKEVGRRIRTSATRTGKIVLQSSIFSESEDGAFHATAEATKVKINGGVAEIVAQVVRDNPAIQVPESITTAAAEELKRLGQVAKVKTVLRVGGKALLIVGILVDGYAIWQAEDKLRESVRVGGAWATAAAFSGRFAAMFTPGLAAGPWAWVAFGAGTLIAGGVGYWVGSQATMFIYDVIVQPKPVAGAGS